LLWKTQAFHSFQIFQEVRKVRFGVTPILDGERRPLFGVDRGEAQLILDEPQSLIAFLINILWQFFLPRFKKQLI
jgi:hypothetical protein